MVFIAWVHAVVRICALFSITQYTLVSHIPKLVRILVILIYACNVVAYAQYAEQYNSIESCLLDRPYGVC